MYIKNKLKSLKERLNSREALNTFTIDMILIILFINTICLVEMTNAIVKIAKALVAKGIL